MNKEVVPNVTALATTIAEGLAKEEDRGIALRTIQTALGVGLVSTVQDVADKQNKLNELLGRCIDKFTSQVDEMLVADTIDHEALFEMITTLQKNQVAIAELQRKIVQSPNKIFTDDLLSPDEQKLLRLLKSFKTSEDKKRFLKAVETAMKPDGSNEFDA